MLRTDALVGALVCAGSLGLASCGGDGGRAALRPSKVESVTGVLDVSAPPYNAVPGTDAHDAIQAALDDSCALAPNNPPVWIPNGVFLLGQTLRITCTSDLVGASRQGTVLHPTFNGPAILIERAGGGITTGPALVGSGSSMTETSTTSPSLNLRDVPAVELDGLGAFTAEAFFKLSASTNGNYESIVTSEGILGNGGPPLGVGEAFSLAVNSDRAYATLTIQGSPINLISVGSLSIGAVHHEALTYDGATVRLLLDGAVVASRAVSGTISQRAYEDVTIGGAGEGLEGNPYFNPIAGAVDSVRLSNVARYTSAYPVPTTKLSSDANTLVLANFEAQSPGMTRVSSGNSTYWIPVRGMLTFYGGNFHDFTVDGGMGIVGMSAWQTDVYAVDCVNCDYGFFFVAGSNNTFDDVRATAGTNRGRFGLYSGGGGGNEFDHVVVDGQALPLVVYGGYADILSNITVNPGGRTVFGMLMDRNDPTINGFTIEAGGDAYQAAVVLVGALRPGLFNGQIAGIAGHVRRSGAPAASTMGAGSTRSIIPVLVDKWGTAAPNSTTPILHGATVVNCEGCSDLVHLDFTPPTSAATGTIAIGPNSDSNTLTSNDPNLIAMPATAQPPPAALIPTRDPGATALLGGAVAPGVLNVTDFGAVPTPQGSNWIDASTGVQAAVDAACARGGGTVFIPGHVYSLSRPVVVSCNLEIDGISARTQLPGGAGAAIVVYPPGMTGIDPGPPLVGTGHSMKTNAASYWVDLRNSGYLELDGNGASTNTTGFTGFTVEAFVEMTAAVPGYAGIVQSSGCLGTPGGTLPGCTSAFELAAVDGHLHGLLKIGGTAYPVEGPAITLNAVHHVAVTYDGVQTIRLFLDGQAVQSAMTTTVSGAITQEPGEDGSIGAATTGFEGAVRFPAMPGYIDSLRISKVGEYTANFTAPTSALPVDARTLALLNFDQNDRGLTPGSNGIQFPIVRTAEPNGAPEGTVSVILKSINLDYYGIFGVNAVHSKFLNLYSEGGGITLAGNTAGSVFDNVAITYGRFGILTTNADGSVFHNITLRYQQLPFVVNGGAGVTVDKLTASPNNALTAYAIYDLAADLTIHGIFADATTPGVWKGHIVVDHPTAPFQLFKGELAYTATPSVAALTVDGGMGYIVEGTSFGLSHVDTHVIHLNAPLAVGAPHIALGIHYEQGSNVTDDPDVQLTGAGTN